MPTVVKPPTSLTPYLKSPSIFLAGSIEMDKAVDWQAQLTAALNQLDIVIFNPRRENWDSSWEQSIDNPNFREQVEWELAALEAATRIVMYFDPATKSPISLLELGLFARSEKLVVCCPDGFWRKGNVDIVCAKYGITQLESLDRLVEYILKSVV